MTYTPKHAAVPPRRRRLAGAALAGAAGLVTMGMTAPAAQAATVWDRLAECESGGNWAINTGNGFYGGLQFAHSTWVGFGGQEYAQYAHQASKTQQIDIAQRVLEGQGPGAWPVCSVEAGLTASNGGTSTGASGSGSTQSEGSSGGSASSQSTTEAEVETRSEAAEPAPAEPAPAESAPVESVPAEPAPAQETPVQDAPRPQAEGPEVTVRPGDTVAALAAQHGVTVRAIVEANGLVDADYIVAGWTLVIPQQAQTQVHTVEQGDTVAALAQEYGSTVGAIVDANDLEDADFILIGEDLQVPAA